MNEVLLFRLRIEKLDVWRDVLNRTVVARVEEKENRRLELSTNTHEKSWYSIYSIEKRIHTEKGE